MSNDIKIISFSVIFLIFLVPYSFAEEENFWESESKITVSIIGSSIIDLDSSNRLIRAYVDIVNFDPSDGRYVMKIVQPITANIISEKEIVIREKSNGESGSDAAYMIKDDDIITNGTTVLGDYLIEISSERGSAIGGAIFSIIHPSETGVTPIYEEIEVNEFSDDTNDLSETENIDEQIEEESVIESIQKIPDWVKNIFILYADGSITENELISALSFLIDEGIILVNQ